MNRQKALLVASLMAVSSAPAAVLNVSALADIFGAGHASPPSGPYSGGVLPPSYAFASGTNLVLMFYSVTGTVSSGADTTGPDGAHGGPSTDMSSLNGVSGFKDSSSGFCLIGMFASANEPSNPAPAVLDFSPGGIGESFYSLSPALNQTFFVGDGLTGTGTGSTQFFNVPIGATRLFLGFADGNSAGGVNSDLYNYHGSPSYYSDNTGSLVATFIVTTKPVIYVQKAIYLTSSNLLSGTNYQIQASSDLINWTNQGSVFTATNSNWRSTNYWDVSSWNNLFFRLQQQ